MAKEEFYQQCKLMKNLGDGATQERIIWGPSSKTQVGKMVKVEEDDKTWTDGWEVKEVYGEPQPANLVTHRSQDYKRQRSASDI